MLVGDLYLIVAEYRFAGLGKADNGINLFGVNLHACGDFAVGGFDEVDGGFLSQTT